MDKLSIKTIAGDTKFLQDGFLTDLRSRVRGEVLAPSDASYDEAPQIWNAMIDRKPGVIVRCSGTADVMQTVRTAKENDLLNRPGIVEGSIS